MLSWASALARPYYLMTAGVLGFPFAYRLCGLVLTSVLVLVSLTAGQLSMHLLLLASQAAGKRNYEELCRSCLGRAGERVLNVCVFLLNLGALVAYVNVLADVLSSVAGSIIPPGAEPSRSMLMSGDCPALKLGWMPLARGTGLMVLPLTCCRRDPVWRPASGPPCSQPWPAGPCLPSQCCLHFLFCTGCDGPSHAAKLQCRWVPSATLLCSLTASKTPPHTGCCLPGCQQRCLVQAHSCCGDQRAHSSPFQ